MVLCTIMENIVGDSYGIAKRELFQGACLFGLGRSALMPSVEYPRLKLPDPFLLDTLSPMPGRLDLRHNQLQFILT